MLSKLKKSKKLNYWSLSISDVSDSDIFSSHKIESRDWAGAGFSGNHRAYPKYQNAIF